MTVSTTHTINSFTGDGAEDTFTYTFQVIESAQIHTYEDDVEDLNITIVVNADQVANPGGTVTFDSGAPANGATVLVRRITSLDQLTEYQLGGNFPSESHELALDKLTMIIQESPNAAGDVAQHTVDIAANAVDIAANAVDIAANTVDIAANAVDIAANTASLVGVGRLTQEVAVNLTGLQVDFANVPSWAKKITIAISNATGDGASTTVVELGIGDSTGIYVGGYVSQQCILESAGVSHVTSTNAFKLAGGSGSGLTDGIHVVATLVNLTGNVWVLVANGQSLLKSITSCIANGSLTLADTLDQLRIYQTGGSAFTTGVANIIYEG